MADEDLASHFETVLDREDAPERAPRAPRREREEEEQGVEQEELFPQREVEADAAEDDDTPPRREEIDDEDEEEDDRPRPEPDEEEDDQQAALDLNQIVAVNVDGERAEVSLQEALNGYVRAETFHRRLNQLGQVAQEIEKERGDLARGREYYAQMIPALHQQLLSLQPEEPNWDKLYEENPAEAARLERQWRTYREKLGQLSNEHQRVRAEQEAERQRQDALYEDAQRHQLVKLVPEWTDPKRWERDRRAMIRTAMAVGYSEQELGGLRDAKATLILRKAALYDMMMAAKPKPVRQQGALRPGAISSRAAPNGLARAEKRLQRSGSVRDAARAFEMDLDREG
jgi:chromosome segregation ATPase